jgi:type 1 glutamine amidotransferase
MQRPHQALPSLTLTRFRHGATWLAILAFLSFNPTVPLHSATAVSASSSASRIVILIGEDEYLTWETLPAFAELELHTRGHQVQVVHQDPANIHLFPDLIQALANADLLFLSVRRRGLPKAQLDAIRAHLTAGKPLVAIRTSSHAFAPRGADREALATDPHRAEWTAFDPEVLGGNYSGHFGSGVTTTIRPVPEAAGHPILAGLDLGAFQSVASLYRTSPLAQGTTTLLIGQIPGDRVEPVAWTYHYGPNQAPVFYTSLGHPEDFANPTFRQLLVNGITWALTPAKETR